MYYNVVYKEVNGTAEKKKKFDQARYIRDYMKQNTYRLQVILNRKKDAEMIKHLEKKGSKSGYVKQLIQEDMNKDKD